MEPVGRRGEPRLRMGAGSVHDETFQRRVARGLVLGSFAWAGCVVYDESLIARGNASDLGGPSTVFVTTGWNIASGGAGPAGDAGSDTGSGGNGAPWDAGTRDDDAWGGTSTDGHAGDTGR